MFYYTASLQSAPKTAKAFDFACATMDRLYWLDDNYNSALLLLRFAYETWLSAASTEHSSPSLTLPFG